MLAEKKGFISKIKVHTGVNVNRCYQCGKCSAGCAVNEEMDFPPSIVMRMLQTGEEACYNELLHSQTIWLCVSCQNCVTRCPMAIDIPQLMDYLREKALQEQTVNKNTKNIVSFHHSFLDSIKYTGRLYEIGLIGGYKMRSLNLLQDLTVAPGLFFKGKLPLLPEMVKNRKQMKTIFREAKEEELNKIKD